VHDGVGQRLAGVGVLLHELAVRVEAGRRHRAAEDVLRALERAGVADDLHVALLLQHGHHRVDVAHGVDLAGAQRRQGAGGVPTPT
jgi:hypothetical protein